MQITVTHTLTLSDDTKQFLKELFARPQQPLQDVIVPINPENPVVKAIIEGTEERKKVVPPGIACTRIGQDTTDAIMKLLPADIETIEKAIKRKRFDAEALLKLLWERNKLGYDGEVYHGVR